MIVTAYGNVQQAVRHQQKKLSMTFLITCGGVTGGTSSIAFGVYSNQSQPKRSHPRPHHIFIRVIRNGVKIGAKSIKNINER